MGRLSTVATPFLALIGNLIASPATLVMEYQRNGRPCFQVRVENVTDSWVVRKNDVRTDEWTHRIKMEKHLYVRKVVF